ncbi:MAG: PQQ-binding-like beta-propeller repeat protein [bacterium]
MLKWMEKAGQVTASLALAMLLAAPVALADSSAANMRNCKDSDWCHYHRDVKGWRYSPLSQINPCNVQNLRPVWIFQPGESRMGMMSTPLVVGGTMFISTNPSTVWALNGATGDRIWAHVPEMDAAVTSRSFFNHTRGLAVGDGRVYMGQSDGKVVALNETNGDVIWSQQLVNSERDTVGFSGAGTFVSSDLLVIGQNGGEYPIEGRIFGLDPRNGNTKWIFYTTGRDDPQALATWGGDSWKYGGGGSWQPGSVDYKNNQILIGIGNPNPDYDYCGDQCRDTNSDAWRPGDNLYTSSTVALDLGTGKLNWYFMEAPSDPYDYDASPGEYVIFTDKDGRDLVLHPGKNGFNHVHMAKGGKPVNVYPDMKNFNWTTGFNLQTGEWENMLWPKAGEKTLVCPAIDGGHSWNPGSYNPQTGLFYRIVNEWCMWLTVSPKQGAPATAGAETRTTEPFVQAFMAAEWAGTDPPNERAHGRLTAREPVSGKLVWENKYDVIPHSALVSTGGGLVFNATYEGYVEALDANTGKQLWKFNDGTGHNGGIISYAVGGKQYIAVPAGHGSYVGGAVQALFPDALINYERTSSVVTFALP